MKTLSTTTGVAVVLAATQLLAACASVSPDMPPELQPAANQRALVVLGARGVQIYECRGTASSTAPAWAFVAPEAELFDPDGRVAGSHGAGPHWRANDGSNVVGTVAARKDAPDATAIPWLLLTTRSTGGKGRFEGVTSIQRLNTRGGLAPASGCTTETLGARARVPYVADYRLFTTP